MIINKISYPTPLSNVRCVENDNIDVFVELEDGYTYTLVLITPQNIKHLMEKNKKCYFDVGHPMIIVKELTQKCINSAIKAFSEGDAYWLKEYHLSGSFDIKLLDDMLREQMSELD